MRVAMVSPYLDRCGVARYSGMLVKALSKYVDVYAIRHHRFGELYNSYLSWLLKRIKRVSPDVVHIQHEYGIFRPFERFVKFLRMLDVPTVVTMHTVGVPSMDSAYDSIDSVKAVVVLNEALASILSRFCSKVRVIPFFVPDVPLISKEEARNMLNIPQDAFVVSTLGFIDYRKGTDIFLDVVSKLEGVYPIIVGGWHTDFSTDYVKNVLKRAGELGVRVTGWVSDDLFYAYVSASDVIVLPIRAITESFTVHVALAYRKLVVVADADPLRDKPVVRCGSAGEMVEAIRRADELYKKLRGDIDRYVAERSLDRIAKMHSDLYSEVVR